MGVGAVHQTAVESDPQSFTGAVHQTLVASDPESFGGSVHQTTAEGRFLGVRAKQLAASTFTESEVDRTFVAQAIDGDRLKNASVTEVQLASSVAGNGLSGGAGSALAIDGASTVSFSGASWTFVADELLVTGTPTAANAVVNKTYVDNQITGLAWKDPVCVISLLGERTVAQINALTPATGDAVVATDAGTPTAGTSDALAAGDLAEFDGTSWIKLYSNAAGQLPTGLRMIVSTTATIFSPFADSTDDGKIVESVADAGTFDGSNSDFDDTGDASDGNAVLVQCAEAADAESAFENNGYTFDGATPTGSWIQFTGAGQINAGAGLSKSGNTLNVGDVNRGVQVNADDLELDISEAVASDGGLEEDSTNSWQMRIKTHTGALGAAVSTSASGIDIDGDKVDITFTPTNYTPDAGIGEADDVDDLAAHLKGIDDALASAGANTPNQETLTTENISGSDTALSDTLNNVPVSNASVKLFLNGIQQVQGAGADYTVSSQTITWLASSGTAVDMDTTDVLVAVYDS